MSRNNKTVRCELPDGKPPKLVVFRGVTADLRTLERYLWGKYEAAKRGLSLAWKLKPSESRARHIARILGNLNKLRGMYKCLVSEMKLKPLSV